jgi:acetate kinase
MVAVFDTAFHQTMPEKAYMYAIPYEYFKKYKIRRYGFHGTSHRFVTMKTSEILGIKESNINLITCHLGNGSSFTAVKNGKSVDTSMGFTPLEGMVMGTRSGDLDPSIVNFIEDKENLCCNDMDAVLNKKSGLLGLSGVSSDMRDLEAAAAEGNHRAQISLDLFSYRAKKYIGSYAVAIGSCLDAIVFTAGIGENAPDLREQICENLEIFGAKLDKEKNYKPNPCIISTDDSKVKIMVVPTNEELMIALDTEKVVRKHFEKTQNK